MLGLKVRSFIDLTQVVNELVIKSLSKFKTRFSLPMFKEVLLVFANTIGCLFIIHTPVSLYTCGWQNYEVVPLFL